MKRNVFAMLLFLCTLFAGAASVSDRFAYVTSEGDNNFSVVDLNTERVVKVLLTGKTPHALAFTKDGKCYVNNRGSKDITVIDANKFEVIKTISLPTISMLTALSPDGKTLAVVYKEALNVSFIDTTTDTITKTITIGKEPEGVFKGAMMKHPLWSKNSRYIYASDNVNNTIVKIDVATGEIKATIVMPGSNHHLHPSKDSKLLYAVNETTKGGGTSITLIDSETDKIIKDIPIHLVGRGNSLYGIKLDEMFQQPLLKGAFSA